MLLPLMVLLALFWFSVGYVGERLIQFWLYYGLVWCNLGSVLVHFASMVVQWWLVQFVAVDEHVRFRVGLCWISLLKC